MKKIIVLFGFTACCVAPLSAQNTPGDTRERTHIQVKASPVASPVAPAQKRERTVYYITSFPQTGSHIPLVVRRYRRENAPMFQTSSGSGYNAAALGHTDAGDVGGALLQLDPAISSAR